MSLVKTYVQLSIALIALAFLTSCGGEEPNPCAEEKPISADFRIEETFQLAHLLPDSFEFHDTDTVNTNYVMFTALEDSAEYEWQLGSETITTRSFTRYGFPRGENIQISLKVSKMPNLDCFPDDDGEDKVNRSFYVTEQFICGTLATGTYVGYDIGDEDNVRTVSIDVCYDYPDNPFDNRDLRLVYLVEGCDIYGFGNRYARYKYLDFGGNGTRNCLNPTGVAKISGPNNDSIRIEYEIDRTTDDYQNQINKTFIGIRK